jgi:hypothetical protein
MEGYLKNRDEYKAKRDLERAEFAKKAAAEWDSIKNLDVIPATVDNIRIVLRHLNSMNWGVWDLPKLSISYSAHQYDCDGVQASTITLDKPISCDDYGIKNERFFKTGGRAGHLNKYQSI